GRPSTCGGYTCEPLRAFGAGRRSYDEALGVIRLVRSLARDLEVAIGLPPGGCNRRTVRDFLVDRDPASDPAEHVDFLIAFQRLTYLGQKYFGYELEQAEAEAAAAGGIVTDARARAR